MSATPPMQLQCPSIQTSISRSPREYVGAKLVSGDLGVGEALKVQDPVGRTDGPAVDALVGNPEVTGQGRLPADDRDYLLQGFFWGHHVFSYMPLGCPL